MCEDGRMTQRQPHRRLGLAAASALSAAALLIAPALTPAAGIMASASAEPCPDVELVFARGTSEPAGIGRVGQALADNLQGQLGGRSLGTYGVNYPATYDFLAAADGATDATNHIAAMAAQCPSTRIVLGGYSQGAAVVDMLAGIPPLGNKVGEIGSAPPLPASLTGNVAAAAVFGNPSTKKTGIARKNRPAWLDALIRNINKPNDFYAVAPDEIRPAFYAIIIKAEIYWLLTPPFRLISPPVRAHPTIFSGG